MTASYFAIPTLAGQAAIAAAVAGSAPLTISSMVLGDGGGSPTTPLQTQTALVNQVASVAVQSVARSTSTPTQVSVSAIVDETVGGFTIREVGLLDAGGNLLFVANVPDTAKQTISAGVDDVLTLGLQVVISAAANITLVVAGTTYATQNFVDTQINQLLTNIDTPARPYFLAVISASTIAPPASPSVGDAYLVPATGATGAWSAYPNRLAQWVPISPLGAPAQWIFRAPPLQSMVGVADVGLYYEMTSAGWRSIFATLSEHLAGSSSQLHTNPAGVSAMIAAALANALPLEGVLWCGVSTGAANAQALTPTQPIAAYVEGQGFSFLAGFTNTGALQIGISGIGLVNVLKEGESGPAPLTGGEVVAGETYTVRVDASGHLQLQATELGTASLKNTGATIADPGTGALEISQPVEPQSAASYTYQASDRGALVTRSNGGAAMTDLLAASGAQAAGWTVRVRNCDATAALTLSAPAGVLFNGGAGFSLIVQPRQTVEVNCDGAQFWVERPIDAVGADLLFYLGCM